MITLIRGFGNHSNRLIQSVHFEAYCIENNYKFKSLDFDDMAPLYDGCVGFKRNFWDRLLFVGLKIVRKIQNKSIFKPFRIYDYDLLERDGKVKPRDGSFVCGWNFRQDELVKKYQNVFQQKYKLRKVLYENNPFVRDFLSEKESSVCVGFHIRRGDYKEWNGGIWYYEKEEYIDIFKKLERFLSAKHSGKKIIFYIFSNEDVCSWFDNFSDVRISKNEWFIDQFLMSQMDYLMGPPSTFTMWASYIGLVPLCFIEKADAKIDGDSFKVVEAAS